jgi:hypothetical protein
MEKRHYTFIQVKFSKNVFKTYKIYGDKGDIYDFVFYILNRNPMKHVIIIKEEIVDKNDFLVVEVEYGNESKIFKTEVK